MHKRVVQFFHHAVIMPPITKAEIQRVGEIWR